MQHDMYVVIVGCGRLGSLVASRLSKEGHSVVVIDVDELAFDNLSAEFSGFQLEGDATELAMLRQAKIDKADVFIACTHDDNVNLMVAQIAGKIFSVRRVLARVFDPQREEVYSRLGIETICPTCVGAAMFFDSVEAMRGEGKRIV